ncbi:MAG: glutathione S-transferase family protein [Alphaproteobacteria bacterium]|nr:glutathione S-transferase family protein [Alphaproteobacteria bacterium]
MLELYHGGTSVCSVKVRLVLAEKGLEWKSRYFSLVRREHQTEAYRAINPNLKVPALVDDGVPVIESTIINEYLDDRFPDPPLRPADAQGRARMRRWTQQLDTGIHDAAGTVTYCIAYRYQRLALSQEDFEAYLAKKPVAAHRERSRDRVMNGIKSKLFPPALARMAKMVADMERQLSETAWLAGESYSLADAGFTAYVNRLDQLQLAPLWADCPNVEDWYRRVRARPSFAQATEAWFAGEAESIALMAEKGAEEWPHIEEMLGAIAA